MQIDEQMAALLHQVVGQAVADGIDASELGQLCAEMRAADDTATPGTLKAVERLLPDFLSEMATTKREAGSAIQRLYVAASAHVVGRGKA